MLQAFQLMIVLHLLLLLLDSNQVINALRLAGQPGSDQILYINKALTKLIWIILYVLVHFEGFKDRGHLLLRQWLVDELIEELAQ